MNTTRNLDKAEWLAYKLAFQTCLDKRTPETQMNELISQVVGTMSMLVSSPDDLRAFLEEEISIPVEPSIISVSEEVQGQDNWWDDSKNLLDTLYWNRYEEFLQSKPGWSLQAVEDIDDATSKVMNALANPIASNSCERMGMVFGYVQSGKTAHYMGLINKAIDAGYKIVIILSGIHNSLRSQTQTRIDEEVLGYETSIDALSKPTEEQRKNTIGVGQLGTLPSDRVFQALTTRDGNGDVSKKTISVSMNPPYIIVTKKNASVLKKLLTYFQKSQCAVSRDNGKIIPENYPALIIDDEADQASINTRECFDDSGNPLKDFEPTAINGLIRKLLALFAIRSYVGYTATPFANIFIPPKISDPNYGLDLFPRDFIMRIPRADQYIGAKEFFGLIDEELEIDAPPMPLYRKIVNGQYYLAGAKAGDPVGDLPAELKLAVKHFIISTAIRYCRGHKNKPNTMLIHIIRYKAQQNKVKQKVSELVEELFALIRYGDMQTIQEMYDIWASDYADTSSKMRENFSKYMGSCTNPEWSEIIDEIRSLARDKGIIVNSINGDSRDSLIYKDHVGRPFNVIAIGGDKLSRGLTLEGLTISYFTRSSTAYDTLMQMGRWFGYRPGYADLCRLFTTNVLHGYYRQISMATEDLVRQFDYLSDMNLTPNEFGLRVATHPELLLSSKNKIRTGEEAVNDFSCKRSQTRILDRDPQTILTNYEAVEQLISSLDSPSEKRKLFLWSSVSKHYILKFFSEYKTAKIANRVSSFYIMDYISDQVGVGNLLSWNVGLINAGNGEIDIGNVKIGSGVERKFEIGPSDAYADIRVLMSAGDEYLDYTPAQESAAENLAAGKYKGMKSRAELIRRDTRKKPCLLLYPIIGKNSDSETLSLDNTDKTPVFGMAVMFPDRDGKGCRRSYRLNDIALEGIFDEMD